MVLITVASLSFAAIGVKSAAVGFRFVAVFGRAFFRYVWDGSTEKMANFAQVELTPYRLIESNMEITQNELLKSLEQLTEKIGTWNSDRLKEIDEFLKKAK